MITLLLIGTLISIFDVGQINATPRTIIVPTHYPTISMALKFANDGDTIYVLNGTYNEDYISVDKSVRLIGENKYGTIINGSITIANDNVVLRGFTIIKVFPPNTGGYAISLYRASNVLIEDNIISCNSGSGIYFQTDPGPPPENITIRGNNILWYNVSWETWSLGGIYVGSLINYDYSRTSRRISIINNRIEGWPDYAVAGFLSGKNKFINNTILNTRCGIGFGFSESGNLFRGNLINGTEYGFSIWSQTLEGLLQDVDTSNLIDGRPIYYLVNRSDIVVNSELYPNAGYLGLINSRNCTIQNLNMLGDLFLAYTIDAHIIRSKLRDIGLFKCENLTILNSKLNLIVIDDSEKIGLENNIFEYLSFDDFNNITIVKNFIKNGGGICGRSGNYCIITQNNIVNCSYGIYLSDISSAMIFNNNISCNKVGICLDFVNGIKVYLNNLINNTVQCELGSISEWTFNNGYEGNYWSDYNGTDINRDGIGDTNIPHQYADWLPLMGVIRFLDIEHDGSLYEIPIISNSTVTYGELNETLKTLNLTVSGPYNTIGFCRMSVQKDIGLMLLNNNYTILVNGNEPCYIKNWTTGEYVLIYFEYEHPKDLVPPISSDNYDGLWHNTDFTITLTATDNASGVAEIYYRINNGNIKTVSVDGQPIITTEGLNNTLEYWSIDNVGNEELPHKILTGIKLDKTAPTSYLIVEDWDVGYVTIAIAATDNLSGIKEIKYSFDATTWITYTGPITLSYENVTTIYYRAIDIASNIEAVKSYSIWNGTTIYIRADGSIDPLGAPIMTTDNMTYILMDNINITAGDGLVIERDSIILDGAGHIIQGHGNGAGISLSNRVNVTIKNVSIKRFYYGMYIHYSNNNIIYGNTIIENSKGITLDHSLNNKIYHNNFINNTQQISLHESYGNIWNEDYPNGGNYWSDYMGVDEKCGPHQNEPGRDGIGDTPYRFEGAIDRYPLMEPWLGQEYPPVARFTYGDIAFQVGKEIVFNASSSFDWNNDILFYVWDFGDGNITSASEPVAAHVYVAHGMFNVTLTVIDSVGFNSSISRSIFIRMPSFISVSTSSLSTLVGFKVDIYGTLTDIYGNGLENQTVVIYYTFPGEEEWIPISSDTTDRQGKFLIEWIPQATGSFTIKATWAGNTTHLGAASTIRLDSLSYEEYVFIVESNSTISALAFNATDMALSFTASGPENTIGYAKVIIAKSLVKQPEKIRVYIDGNQVEYSLTSADDSWIILLTYSHSNHKIVISLKEAIATFNLLEDIFSQPLTILFIIIVAAAITIAFLTKKKSKNK